MRQGGVALCLFFMMAIVGCGSSGGYKTSAGSSINTNLASGTSPGAGSSNPAPGTTAVSGTTTPGSTSASGTGAGSSTTSTTSGGPSAPPATPSSPAAPSATSETQVVISSPVDGATISSPAQVAVAVIGSTVITSMQLYVDDAVGFQVASPQINAPVQLPAGAHAIVAQAWDQNGNSYKSAPTHVIVQASAAPPAPSPSSTPGPAPAPAANAGQLQSQAGWDDCDVCAGDAGNGPHTPHAMVPGISSPSLSGAAARFDVSGTPWGAALWWHEIGAHDEAQNLKYDLDFYVDSIANAQALEFDVNQTAGGNKYIFGTECDFRGSGTWRVWNGPGHGWASTGVGCAPPDPGWHHLTWEFQRSGGQAHFVAVTLDGNRHDVGMAFSGIGQGGSGLDVAFQADLNGSGGNQSIWLDNLSLSW